MSLAFNIGDLVDWTDPDNSECSGRFVICGIIGDTIELVNEDGDEAESFESELKHVYKLFSVYHQHEYGSTQWLLKSPIFPNEDQVVEALGIYFEPEKDEFIAIEEIKTIHTLELS